MLIVDLSRQLPDVNRFSSLPQDLDQYGRCAVLRHGGIWVAGTHSSHPPNTLAGFYWATISIGMTGRDVVHMGSVLFVSARNVVEEVGRYVDESFVKELACRVGLRGYGDIHWQR